jgi:coenzyme Q-binding protein COQ10
MPTHAEQRNLPFSPAQVCALVADVEKYPEFLPWCTGVRVRKQNGETFEADLLIGFKMIRERYTSRVTVLCPEAVHVEYLKGPFKYLNNRWHFIENEDGTTTIDFYIDFEFKNRVLQKLIGALFGEAVSVMVSAFEKRAYKVYGQDGLHRGGKTSPQSAQGHGHSRRQSGTSS